MSADEINEALISRVIQSLSEKLAARNWKGWERRNMVGCMTVFPSTGVAVYLRRFYAPNKYRGKRAIPAGKTEKPWNVPFDPAIHDHWYTLEVIDLIRNRRRSNLLFLETREGELWYQPLAAMSTKAQELANFHSPDEPKMSLDMTLDWLAQKLARE